MNVRQRFNQIFFQQLLNICKQCEKKEGMPINVARVGGASFTIMCVLKDYSCNPHIDQYNNSYKFFIWIGADDKI